MDMIQDDVRTTTTRALPGVRYMGHGYDINGQYADPQSVLSAPLFDFGTARVPLDIGDRTYEYPEAMEVVPLFETSYEQQASQDIEEFRRQMGADVGVSGGYGLFSASLDTAFRNEAKSLSFVTFSASRLMHRLWRIALPSSDQLRERLLPQVRRDLEDPDVAPATIFERYGAYFLAEAVVGGRLDYTATTTHLRFTSRTDVRVAAAASFDDILGRAAASTSVEAASERASFRRLSRTVIQFVGGDAAAADRIIMDKAPAEAYVQWAESLSDKATLMAFTPGSLRPIWDLVVSEVRRRAFEDAFQVFMSHAVPAIPAVRALLEFEENTSMAWAGNDEGTGAWADLTVFNPVFGEDSGWRRVAQFGQPNHRLQPEGRSPILRDTYGLGLLAAPFDWHVLWWHKSGSKYFACLRPVPLTGYCALGFVMLICDADDAPDGKPLAKVLPTDFACVRAECCEPIQRLGDRLWDDKGSRAGTFQDVSLWRFDVKPGCVDARAFLAFTSHQAQPLPADAQLGKDTWVAGLRKEGLATEAEQQAFLATRPGLAALAAWARERDDDARAAGSR